MTLRERRSFAHFTANVMWLCRRMVHMVSLGVAMLWTTHVAATDVSYPFNFLKADSGFRKAYRAALGKDQEPWLTRLSGPQAPIEYVSVGREGEEYLLLTNCKAHACDTENVVILYSSKRAVAYAKVRKGGKLRVLGSPPSDVRLDLERLYHEKYKEPHNRISQPQR